MTVRFRIRTQAGQELSFASREMFEDFVRAGDLSPADLVYDGETGSWSPARTNPIVLEIEYENEEGKAARAGADRTPTEPSAENAFGLSLAPPGAGEEAPDEASSPADAGNGEWAGGGIFGLDLALQDELSPEEASKAFVERMKAEREAEQDLGRSGGLGGFHMEASGALADLVSESPRAAPEPRAPEPAGRSGLGPEWSPVDRRPASGPPDRSVAARGDGPSASRAVRGRPSGTGRGRKVVGLMLLGAVVVVGGVVGVGLAGRTAQEEPVSRAPAVPVETIPVEPRPTPPPAREPVIANTEAAVRERAHERFLTKTQAALRDLQPPPDAWPTAEYLTLPSAHPEVVDVFQTYRNAVAALRAGDEARYRAAYAAALEDAGVEGDEAAERLELAMVEFVGTEEAWAAHYDRVDALASAAIRSHEALLEAEGLLVPGAPSDAADPSAIGAGVSGRDQDSQLLLEQIVELLTDVLEGEGAGAGTPANVRAWVWDGILDAVIR